MHIGYWWESKKEGDHWKVQGISGWRGLGEKEWDGMDWIDLAQDRDQWRALVNTVVNLRVR
jgi:hypothetical protein